MSWAMFWWYMFWVMVGYSIARGDQTELVRKLETGSVSNPDAYVHGMYVARGAYGLTYDAWTEVSDMPWIMAHNREHARKACGLYLDLTYKRLKDRLNREPSFADVYAGYRYGVTGYVRMGGKISSTPAKFQKKMQDYLVPYQRFTK